jgi:transcriptional regulator with XRE-family HTH domain
MDDVRVRLGKRVRALREERGLSQEQLSLASGTDRTYISGIERGVRNVAVCNLERIANALRVTLSQLMEGV